ncbi:MAG TPA: hypothetical protein VJP59_09025 [Gemmatimonadota bacterium]|nr:hypothetical protein [Gemmatimonadota bacterium]
MARLGPALAAGVLTAVACGSGDEGYPSRDWSGRYATRVVEASTDCQGATGPPPISGLILSLEHYDNNRAAVQMTPVIRLAGSFQGDHLETTHFIQESVALPDTLLARATPADSVETITYSFEADFERNGFQGRYVIRAPDLRALVLEGTGKRCQIRYTLSGQRIREASEQPATASGPPAGSPG